METPHATYTIGNKRLEIWQDEHAESPRTSMDNLGTFLFQHRRYNFGDSEKAKKLVGSNDADAYRNFADRSDVIALPVYMYDHSGQTIKVGRHGNPFSCRWDSGFLGWIVVTKANVREEYGWKKLNRKRIEQIETYLEGEIETYDQYMRGDIYGFQEFEINPDTKEEKEIHACWGFYGDNVRDNGMIEHISKEWEQLFPKKDENDQEPFLKEIGLLKD